jgi:hypothetical protein
MANFARPDDWNLCKSLIFITLAFNLLSRHSAATADQPLAYCPLFSELHSAASVSNAHAIEVRAGVRGGGVRVIGRAGLALLMFT